jgi:hypothetical protein
MDKKKIEKIAQLYKFYDFCKYNGCEPKTYDDCENCYFREVYNTLATIEAKIENGTLIECNHKLIGELVVGIHQYTDGTYAMDLDEENIVIGFCSDGIVTANTTHAYNDYFKHGLYFIDDDNGIEEAKKKLLELRGDEE